MTARQTPEGPSTASLLAVLAGAAVFLTVVLVLIIAGGKAAYDLVMDSEPAEPVVVVERAVEIEAEPDVRSPHPEPEPVPEPIPMPELSPEAEPSPVDEPIPIPEPATEIAGSTTPPTDADSTDVDGDGRSMKERRRAGLEQVAKTEPPPPPAAERGPPRRLSNDALGVELQRLSPRIQEVRFAMSGGRRHPRIVLHGDTDDAEAHAIAQQVLVAFRAHEAERAEAHGTTVYVDLPPDARTGFQSLEPFALRKLRVEGTGSRQAGRNVGPFEAPFSVMASEVYERNETAFCCRDRRIGELRGNEVIP